MKIQFLNGGLANQAFQYIFARYYELSHPDGIMYLDDSYFALNTVHNGYELEKVFGIRAHMLSECFDKAVWDFILGERKAGKSVPQILQENQIQIQMLSEVDGYRQFNPFDGEVHRIPAVSTFLRSRICREIFIITVTGSNGTGLTGIRIISGKNSPFRRSQTPKTSPIWRRSKTLSPSPSM